MKYSFIIFCYLKTKAHEVNVLGTVENEDKANKALEHLRKNRQYFYWYERVKEFHVEFN